jgi:hypothetical protein
MDDSTSEPDPAEPGDADEPDRDTIGRGYRYHDPAHVDDDVDVEALPSPVWSLGGDLADLPRLVRSKAIVIPAALVVVSSLIYLVAIRTPDVMVATIASILAIFFLEVPPIGAILLAAILADRSAYLAGAIAGFLGPLGLTLAIVGGTVGQIDVPIGVVVGILVESALLGLFLGAVVSLARTGWYRLTRG